jgi:hypothetical protein
MRDYAHAVHALDAAAALTDRRPGGGVGTTPRRMDGGAVRGEAALSWFGTSTSDSLAGQIARGGHSQWMSTASGGS